MTRDEAIAKIQNTMGGFAYEKSELVNSLVALGILKLDEPGPRLEDKLGGMRAFEALRGRGFDLPEASSALDAINLAGLKIVEK